MIDASLRYHNCIESCNFLHAPTKFIANIFDNNPTIYKIALLINHLFRAGMMVGVMCIPHIPFAPVMAICFTGSLFYRLTVERNCAYKFALPAFFGAAAFMLALPAIISMINKTAFTSIGSGFKACVSLIPLILYSIDITLTVNYNVNKALGLLQDENSCCKKQ